MNLYVVALWVVPNVLTFVLLASASRHALVARLATTIAASAIFVVTLRPLPTVSPINSIQMIPVLPLIQDQIHFPLWFSLANIALFIPLGFSLVLTVSTLRRAALYGFLIGVMVETLQFLQAAGRQTDVNDIFLNVLGACLGFCFGQILQRSVGKSSTQAVLRGNSVEPS